MEAIAHAVEALNRSTVDVHLLRPALERLEGVDLDRVANRVQRGLVDADTADAVADLCTVAAQVMPLALAACGLVDTREPTNGDHPPLGINGSDPDDPVDFRRHVGDALADQHERVTATNRQVDELREIVNRLDQQVTRLVRTHPAGDADPESTDTKWLEETIADMDDRLHALEKRQRAERLDAGFRELVETELQHMKESIPGELANRLLRLERAARKSGHLER